MCTVDVVRAGAVHVPDGAAAHVQLLQLLELRRLGITRPVLLIADNLAGQDARFSAGPVGDASKQAAQQIGVRWWNTVDGCTDA